MSYSFTIYHLYLIWAGTTTSETFKWADWAADIRSGEIYIATAQTPLYLAKPPQPLPLPPPTGSGSGSGSEDGAFRLDPDGFAQQQLRSMTEPEVPWPRRARQVLARVPTGGDPGRLPGGLSWKRCEGLAEVENLYDLGGGENLRMVVWPREF